jgi:hypothetical protein
MQIPLSRAPEILFDQQIWEAFQSYFDSNEISLERIGFPPQIPGWLYHREGDKQLLASIKETDQVTAQARDLAVALLLGFQELLLREQVVARGIPYSYGGEPTHEVIPAESWRRLWPNFVENYAMAFARPGDHSCGRYDDITLIIDDVKLRTAELTAWCSAFLRSRRAEDESRRKVLKEEASLAFGSLIPERIFSAAYREVFKKARGRPRKGK